MFSFGIKDLIDILIVSVLLFQVYKLLKGTQAMNIFFAVLGFIIIWFLVLYVFRMDLLGTIFNAIMSFGAIILVILFQDEIKNYLTTMGSKTSKGVVGKLKGLFFGTDTMESVVDIDAIVEATENCARTRTGLLIVIQNDANLEMYAKTGEIINSKISARLIENIFFKNTPLHDGALIIVGNKMVSAGCILPVSHNLNIPKHFGLRHRAALGISEKTDALSIVVSEETGNISVTKNGNIKSRISTDTLKEILSNNQ